MDIQNNNNQLGVTIIHSSLIGVVLNKRFVKTVTLPVGWERIDKRRASLCCSGARYESWPLTAEPVQELGPQSGPTQEEVCRHTK